MDFEFTDLQNDIRAGVREVCSRFDLDYWRQSHEEHTYPTEFVKAMSDAGWLGALIPEEYGGSGLGFTEGAIILEEVNRSGGNCQPSSCPNVYDGCASDDTAAKNKSANTCRKLQAAT